LYAVSIALAGAAGQAVAAGAETVGAAGEAQATVPAPEGERVALAVMVPRPRAADFRPASDRRCSRDGGHCIGLDNYIPDVCRTIEAAARGSAIDRDFFARLIWKESLFDASAVSPAGAQGIAQFMPGTAKLRGLDDAFNPAEALLASADYLSELARTYGNLGLAAAAYNGGEARVEKFIAAKGGLALETRAYVEAITGHSAETWRDAPPDELDLTLDKGADFQAACIAQAANRSLREFRAPLLAWGVVVAANRDYGGAQRQVGRLQSRYNAVLGSEAVVYSRGRRPGIPRAMHYAQVGRHSRAEAETFCAQLRAVGGDCMVLRN
jgi:hypothetical protein